MLAPLKHTAPNTKHSSDCKMIFGRKDESCPRCLELINGSPSRDGWQKRFFAKQKLELRAVAHVCSGKCGSVCTFGEW